MSLAAAEDRAAAAREATHAAEHRHDEYVRDARDRHRAEDAAAAAEAEVTAARREAGAALGEEDDRARCRHACAAGRVQVSKAGVMRAVWWGLTRLASRA